MKRTICIACLAMMSILSGRAQKEAYNWFFGYGAGLTWNTTRDLTATGLFGTSDAVLKGLPDAVAGSPISTVEGCFTLSDSRGQLLFYSDGRTIRNKNHALMPNGTGLTGHTSSTQSGIIIPNPGHPNQYMAISLSINLANNLSWTVIDMTLEGGLGDVVAGQKNIRFTGHSGKTGETVTSVRHANGRDYWILAPGRGESPTYMNAWLVTPEGVSATPVVTALPVTNPTDGTSGYLKISPDRRYFAWMTTDYSHLIYGEFDSATGAFSHVQQVATDFNCYGVEFSASGKYVYVTHATTNRFLYVYNFADLLSGPSMGNRTRKTYAIPEIGTSGALQLAPDGRIYMTIYDRQSYLCVIDNPEDFDNLKIYQLPDGFLAGTARSQLGLPSFAASWFGLSVEGNESFCMNTPESFTAKLSGSGTIAYTEWDFGDGNAPVRDTNVGSDTQTHSHTYARSGSYTITVRMYQSDGKEATKQTLTVRVMPCMLPVNPHIHSHTGLP